MEGRFRATRGLVTTLLLAMMVATAAAAAVIGLGAVEHRAWLRTQSTYEDPTPIIAAAFDAVVLVVGVVTALIVVVAGLGSLVRRGLAVAGSVIATCAAAVLVLTDLIWWFFCTRAFRAAVPALGLSLAAVVLGGVAIVASLRTPRLPG